MLVSADELIAYMSNINLTPPQKTSAQQTLNAVQAELEVYLNRPLELVQVREAVRTDHLGYANVTVSPVHKVINTQIIEVSYGPEPLNQFAPYTPEPMERDALIDPDNGRPLLDMLSIPNFGDPLIVHGAIYIGFPNAWYVVEYVGGYNGQATDGLKQDIMRVAAREVARNADDTLSLRGDKAEQASESDDRVKGWTIEEKAKWDRLRRRVIV